MFFAEKKELLVLARCVSFLSIPPVIFGNAFVDRGFGMGEIIFIPPISLPYPSHHTPLTLREKVGITGEIWERKGRDEGRDEIDGNPL